MTPAPLRRSVHRYRRRLAAVPAVAPAVWRRSARVRRVARRGQARGMGPGISRTNGRTGMIRRDRGRARARFAIPATAPAPPSIFPPGIFSGATLTLSCRADRPSACCAPTIRTTRAMGCSATGGSPPVKKGSSRPCPVSATQYVLRLADGKRYVYREAARRDDYPPARPLRYDRNAGGRQLHLVARMPAASIFDAQGRLIAAQ